MAIYRPPKPRWRLAAAGAIGGLAVGLLLGASLLGGGDAGPVEASRRTRASLTAALSTLEVFAVEYAESVRGGTVVNEDEFRGARDAFGRSRARFFEARPALAQVAATLTRKLQEEYAALAALVEQRASNDVVTNRVAALQALLEEALG